MATNTTPVELTQEELKLITIIFNRSIEQGGLRIGDALLIVPLFQKLDALIEKPVQEGTVLTEPTAN